jgi:hypothetical protein
MCSCVTIKIDILTDRKAADNSRSCYATSSKSIPTLRDQNKYKKQPRLSTFKRGLFGVLSCGF